jgi:hypothetical protein
MYGEHYLNVFFGEKFCSVLKVAYFCISLLWDLISKTKLHLYIHYKQNCPSGPHLYSSVHGGLETNHKSN